LILSNNADVSIVDNSGKSAFAYACKTGNLNIALAILPYCTEEILSKKNDYGSTSIDVWGGNSADRETVVAHMNALLSITTP
jgi:ankyrin repeat protein